MQAPGLVAEGSRLGGIARITDVLIDRRNWLYILAFVLPFGRIPTYEFALGAHSMVIRASFVLAVIVVTAGLFAAVRERHLDLSTPDKWLLAYAAAMIASAVGAISVGRSLQVIAATILVMGLAMVIERTLVTFSLARLHACLLAAALVTCVFGLLQFVGDSFDLPTAVTGMREHYTKRVLGFPRIHSVAFEPLFFASFLLLPLILQVGRLYYRPSRWPGYAALWLMVMVLALTLSRGGIYASLGGMALVLILLRSKDNHRRLAAIAATIAAGALCALCALKLIEVMVKSAERAPQAVETYMTQVTTITSGPSTGDPDRAVYRAVAWQAFRDHPLLGVGIGNFGIYGYARQEVLVPQAVVNNEYLEVLAETGFAGMFTLLGFVLCLGRRVIRAWPGLSGDRRLWAGSICAVLFAAAIQFWAFSTLYIIHIWFSIGVLMALTRDSAPAVVGMRELPAGGAADAGGEQCA